MIILYAILIFACEAVWSYLANRVNIAVISRKKHQAVLFSLGTRGLSWLVLFLVAKLSDWNPWLMSASMIGDVLGDYVAAGRKKKRTRAWRLKSQSRTGVKIELDPSVGSNR